MQTETMASRQNKRIISSNACYPRRYYFQRHITSIVDRMGRILNYECRQLRNDSVRTERIKISVLSQCIQDNDPEIHIIGDVTPDIVNHVPVMKDLMPKEPIERDDLSAAAASVCRVHVVVTELSRDIKKFKSDLKNNILHLGRFLSNQKDRNPIGTETIADEIQRTVLAIRPNYKIEIDSWIGIYDAFKEALQDFSKDIDIDFQKQIVVLSSPRTDLTVDETTEPAQKKIAISQPMNADNVQRQNKGIPTSSVSSPLLYHKQRPLGTQSLSPSPPKYTQDMSASMEIVQVEETEKVARKSMSHMLRSHMTRQMKTCETAPANVSPKSHGPPKSPSKQIQDSLNAMQIDQQEKEATKRVTPCCLNEQQVTQNPNLNPQNAPQPEFTLGDAVSYQFETQLFENIVVPIETLLKDVKEKRDTNAKKPLFTVLDKFMFEVKGLYNQSITKRAIAVKRESENERMSADLASKLLTLDHVRGCGHIYGKLNVHIDDKVDAENKKKLLEDIHDIIKHDDYTVDTLKSQTTMFGQMILCSS